MKKKTLILVLALSVNLCVMSAATSSRAGLWGTFKDAAGAVWGEVSGAIGGAVEIVTDAAGGFIECVGDPVACGKAAGVWFENRWAELMTTGCSDKNTFGIDASCFGDNTFARLHGAMGYAYRATNGGYQYVQNGHSYSPVSFIRQNIDQFYSGGSDAVQRAFFRSSAKEPNATNYASGGGAKAPVVIWPAAYNSYVSNLTLSSMLIHEAQHSHYGSHTCGDGADKDDNGPYGTQARYLFMNSIGFGPNPSKYERDDALMVGIDKVEYQICDQTYRDKLLDIVTSPTVTVTQHFCENNICTDDVPAKGPACRYRQDDNGVYWLENVSWNDTTRTTSRTYRCQPPGYSSSPTVRSRMPRRYKSASFHAAKAPNFDGSCSFGNKYRQYVLYHQTHEIDTSGTTLTMGYYECKDIPPSQETIKVGHSYPLYCWSQGKDWPECNFVHDLTAGQCVLADNSLGTYLFDHVEYQFKDDYAGQYQPKSFAYYKCAHKPKTSPFEVVRKFRYDLTDTYPSLGIPCFGEPYSDETAACYHPISPPLSAGPCYTYNPNCEATQQSEYKLVGVNTYDWHYETLYQCEPRLSPCLALPPGVDIPDLYKTTFGKEPQPDPVNWAVPELDMTREFFSDSFLNDVAVSTEEFYSNKSFTNRDSLKTPVISWGIGRRIFK